MTYTAENPYKDGNDSPGARPRYRPTRHSDLPDTSRKHYNWMSARQTSCRQQTAPPQQRCSKDVTAHPHRPGARPGRPCPVPACSGQPQSGRSGFSPAFGTESLFNLTLALAGWWRRQWAQSRSGCGGSGWAPGLCCGVAVGGPFAGGRVVISGAFIIFLLHNHFITNKF